MSDEKTETNGNGDKPFYKRSRWWFTTVAMILGSIVAANALAADSLAGQIVGSAVAILAKLGYDFRPKNKPEKDAEK